MGPNFKNRDSIVLDYAATLTLENDKIITQIIRTGPPDYKEYWLAKKDGESETKFDRQFTIPPCPVTVTYRPIPEWNMTGDMLYLSDWKQLTLIGDNTILVGKMGQKTDELRQPNSQKTLVPIFGLNNCINFVDRLYRCFEFHLNKSEDRHATDVDEIVTKFTDEANVLKKKLEAAQNFSDQKTQLDLAVTQATECNDRLIDAKLEIDRLNVKIAELEAGQNCRKELTELTSKLQGLNSQVNYLQRCNNRAANNSPRNEDPQQLQHVASAPGQNAEISQPPVRRVNRGYNTLSHNHGSPYDANVWRGGNRGRGRGRGRGRPDWSHFPRGRQYW
jgi:hypothetical protein